MMPTVASPPAVSRSTTTTLAPLFANASAVARPMPLPAPVISATLSVKSRSIALSLSLAVDLPRPGGERSHHIADETARRLVGEITVGVEFGLRLTDQHLRLIDRVHVKEHHAAAQIALCAGAAGHACRGAHDCAWLPSERLIGRARGPIDRILQHTRHRVVVFGAHEEQRVGFL